MVGDRQTVIYTLQPELKSQPRPIVVALLAAIMALAAGLRFWALGHGIPFAVGADEPEIVGRVVTMMKTGDFNPHFFDYPSLYFYMQLVVSCARFIWGAMHGMWSSLTEVSPDQFYLWGRALTAALGTATVYLVYRIGLRWGMAHALVAAAFMAIMPNHVRESHFVLTDVPMTFFGTLAFLLALRASEKGTLASFAWAGAATGLSASVKYYGGLVLLLPMLAVALDGSPLVVKLRRAAAAVGACAVAFLATAPYTILDLTAFLNAFAAMSAALDTRPASDPGWRLYLKHLQIALAWPAVTIAIAGIAVAVVRTVTGPARVRWALLAWFPLVYFWLLSTRVLIFARYLMPLLPFVALAVAIAVVWAAARLLAVRMLRPVAPVVIAAAALAVFAPPAWNAWQFDRQAGRESTYAVAYAWIAEHVPARSSVVIESAGLRLPLERYRVQQVKTLIRQDHEAYLREGVDFLVASSQVYGSALAAPAEKPDENAAYRRLFAESRLLTTIAQAPERPGPEIRIFKVTP
jgi:4-amino-4-deoxy-L-arabinose transferase-like glycosyltransferase